MEFNFATVNSDFILTKSSDDRRLVSEVPELLSLREELREEFRPT